MKPGRELDALVAEKVMGWTRFQGYDNTPEEIRSPNKRDDGMRWHHKEIWGEQVGGKWKRRACAECGDMPDWSTDIAAAWEVVEKMATQRIQLWVGPSQACTNYGCEIINNTERDERDEDDADYTFCDTAPHAICLAALKAVGVEVPS